MNDPSQYQFSAPPMAHHYYQAPVPQQQYVVPVSSAPLVPQQCMVLVPQQYMNSVSRPDALPPAPAAPHKQARHNYHSKPPFKYWAGCKRKNPEHFKKYSHPLGLMHRNQHSKPAPPPLPSPPKRRKHKTLRKIGKFVKGAAKVIPFFL